MKRLIVLVVTGLSIGGDASPGAAAEDAEDPSDLVYQIDRYGIMLEKTVDLGQSAKPALAAPRESTQALMSNLQAAVLQYNYVRLENCRLGYLPKQSCGAPWRPAWLTEPAASVKSRAVVRARADEVSDRVESYWDAACAEAEKRLEHDDWMGYCSME